MIIKTEETIKDRILQLCRDIKMESDSARETVRVLNDDLLELEILLRRCGVKFDVEEDIKQTVSIVK